MPYIGKTPSPVPIDASDIPDDSITAAKIVMGLLLMLMLNQMLQLLLVSYQLH